MKRLINPENRTIHSRAEGHKVRRQPATAKATAGSRQQTAAVDLGATLYSLCPKGMFAIPICNFMICRCGLNLINLINLIKNE